MEAYAKAQGLWHDPSVEPRYSEYIELDLSTVVPSIAGPEASPGPDSPRRVEGDLPRSCRGFVGAPHDADAYSGYDRAVAATMEASDPTGMNPSSVDDSPAPADPAHHTMRPRVHAAAPVTLADGTSSSWITAP